MDGEFKIQDEKKRMIADQMAIGRVTGLDKNGNPHSAVSITLFLEGVELIAPIESMEEIEEFCKDLKIVAKEVFGEERPREEPPKVDRDALLGLLKSLLEDKN